MSENNTEQDQNNRNSGRESFHHTTYTSVPVHDTANCECCPKRKLSPWLKVVTEVQRKGTHLYEPVKSIPSTLLVLFLGVLLLLAFLTQLVEDELPRPQTEEDLGSSNVDRFCEERAWRYIHHILGNESKVCGTPYHLEKTLDTMDLVNEISRDARWNVFTDWQMLTGDYWLNYDAGHVSYYQNVSNVIAILEGQSGFNDNGTTRSSILVNCHYDSVPYSLGTADDVIFCGVMMEALNLLSRRPNQLKHNIIFLINGAEENTLQGAHAFLSHRWFHGVTSVINLEAAGMNGKCNLFQVTDPRLLRAYSRTNARPSAQAFGEYLFATGLIPSDTDFRIWRYYGDLHGVDIAYVKWGHVYHTRNDHPDFVFPGLVQHSGDMLFNLLVELGDMDELSEGKPEATTAIYWDFLYTFLANYSITGAHILDSFMFLFALSSVGYYIWVVGAKQSVLIEFGFSVLGRVLAACGGLLIIFIFTPITIATTIQLRYLSHPWIIVPLYWMPYLVGAVAVSQAMDAWRAKRSGLNRSLRACQAMAATRLLMSAVLFIMLCMPSLVTLRYLITVPLFLMSFASFVTLTVLRIWKIPSWGHLILDFVLSLPATMFLFSIALRLNAILIPIMGRDHSDNPDWTIALLNVLFVLLVPVTLSGLELLFSRKYLWIVLSGTLVASVIVMFIPMNPYSDEGPATQRHNWFHTEIITHAFTGEEIERHSGVLVTKLDTHTPESILPVLREHNFNFQMKTDFTDDCRDFVYCNLPLYRTRFNDTLHQSIFLYTGGPTSVQSSFRQSSQRVCAGETCTLSFIMHGPPHNMITLWPRAGVEIRSWSLQSELKFPFWLQDRPVYVIVHSHATYRDQFPPLEFNITVSAPNHMFDGPLIDVSHHAHKIDHPLEYTPAYRQLVNSMPRYFNIASFMTVRSNYVF